MPVMFMPGMSADASTAKFRTVSMRHLHDEDLATVALEKMHTSYSVLFVEKSRQAWYHLPSGIMFLQLAVDGYRSTKADVIRVGTVSVACADPEAVHQPVIDRAALLAM